MATMIAEIVTLKCENHHQKLVSGLWQFLKCSRGVDFEVQWAGHSIHAHRLLLDLFLSADKLQDTGGNQQQGGQLGSEGASELSALLQFLYKGTVTVPKEQLRSLLDIAIKCDFSILVDALASFDVGNEETGIRPDMGGESSASFGELSQDYDPSNDSVRLVNSEVALGQAQSDEDDHSEDPWELLTDQIGVQTLVKETVLIYTPLHRDPKESEEPSVNIENSPIKSGSTKPASNDGSCRTVQVLGKRRKQFVCNVCRKSFSRRQRLAVHRKCHDGHRPYRCGQCQVDQPTFSRPRFLVQHMTDEHAADTECRTCHTAFHCPEELRQHATTHIADRPYQCGQCDRTFLRLLTKNNHERSHDGSRTDPPVPQRRPPNPTDKRRYKCGQCGADFVRFRVLEQHVREQHSGETVCRICGAEFLMVDEFRCHLSTHVDRPYRCDRCQRTFSRRPSYLAHLEIHRSNNIPNQCAICLVVFGRPQELRDHARIHTNERPFMCHRCGKSFCRSAGLKKHLLVHSGLKAFPCSECQSRFSTRPQLVNHLLIHSGEMPYMCEQCGKKFRKKFTLSQHQLTHSSLKPYSCPVCFKCFRQRQNLNSHLLTHADGAAAHLVPGDDTGRPFRCEHCLKRCTTKQNLFRHQMIHLHLKPYKCEVCQKEFRQSGQLTVHRRIHSQERPFPCPQCDKSFRQRATLLVHSRLHSGDAPFTCPTCGKAFKQAHNLKRHERTHTGMKPYTCDCGKAFAESSNLAQHKKIHDGRVAYECAECSKTFGRPDKLRRHQATTHNVNTRADVTK